MKSKTPSRKVSSTKKARRQLLAADHQLPVEAFDNVPRLAVILTDEATYLTRYERGVPAATYPVALNDVAAALNVFGSSTGLLPPDVLFWQVQAGQSRIGVWLPPAKHTLQFGGRIKSMTIPLPGFVFVGYGISYSIWAANERPTRLSDVLYHAPLPNVYSGGGVCRGTVEFPKCSPETIGAAAKLFFESYFGYDLANNAALQGVDNAIKFLRSLERKREFPLGRLTKETTMEQVIGGTSATPSFQGGDWDDDEDDIDDDDGWEETL